MTTKPRAISHETISTTGAGVYMLTVPSTASAAKITAADATLSVGDAAVRYWEDGGTPTASVGIPIHKDETIEVREYSNLKNITFIRTGATTVTLSVQYYH